MARKNVSVHSDTQFALFLNQIGDRLDGEKKAEFEDVVRRLVRTVDSDAGGNGGGASDHDPMRALGLLSLARVKLARQHTRVGGVLPVRPDFEAIEQAAQQTGASRSNLMALIGQLVFSWSNNESLLIYVLMVLLQTDEPSAAIVFSTLNTTRARLDLVSRLGRIKLGDRATRLALEYIVRRFNEVNQVRNEFMHAMYAVNAKGAITHTQSMRVVNKSGQLSFGQQQAVDRERIEGLIRTCDEMRVLNRKVWDLLPQLEKAVSTFSSGVHSGKHRNGNQSGGVDPEDAASET